MKQYFGIRFSFGDPYETNRNKSKISRPGYCHTGRTLYGERCNLSFKRWSISTSQTKISMNAPWRTPNYAAEPLRWNVSKQVCYSQPSDLLQQAAIFPKLREICNLHSRRRLLLTWCDVATLACSARDRERGREREREAVVAKVTVTIN